MTDSEIISMLKELIEEIDYDIYKEIFVDDGVDIPYELQREIRIVKDHLDASN